MNIEIQILHELKIFAHRQEVEKLQDQLIDQGPHQDPAPAQKVHGHGLAIPGLGGGLELKCK